jgi:hypothetical protein
MGCARVADGFPRSATAPLPRGQWFSVVGRNPTTTPEAPLARHVWVDSGGELRLVWAYLEMELEKSGGA